VAQDDNASDPGSFKDRSVRLVLFGALTVGLGLLSLGLGLLHFLLVFALDLLDELGLPPSDSTAYLSGAAVYGMIGAALVGLGVGSMLKRRWVRPLMLTVAWTWLACGLLSSILTPWLLDSMQLTASSPIDSGAMTLFKFILLGLILAFGVLLPAGFVLVYRDPNIHRTCAARDPRPAWTETCPGPVLGLSVGLGACAVLTLPMLMRPVLPAFTVLLTGWPAGLVLLAGAATCGYLARSTYRMEISGWWGTVALFLLIGAATAVSFATLEPTELFRALGYPEEQIHALEGSAPSVGRSGAWISVAFTLVTLVYLARVRKHFVVRDSN